MKGDCTCDVRPPTHSAAIVRSISGYAVYLDSIEDETVFDPACPFHGDDGSNGRGGQERVKAGDTFICVECGRTGRRDFIGLSGDWAADNPNFEVICASRRACQRRQELRAKQRQSAPLEGALHRLMSPEQSQK